MNNENECKCKLLPLSLSSNTAAEYGDLITFQHCLSRNNRNRNRNTNMNRNTSKNQHQWKQPYSYYNHNDNNHNSSSLLSSLSSSITPLHLAAQNGHIAITSYLLINQYDADLGFILPSSSSSEHNNNNNIEKQKYIQKYKLSTPLHRACYSGSLSCIKLLLDFGANIFTMDYSMEDGMTPLHKAIKGGRYLVVLFLLDYLKSVKNDNNNDDDNNHHSSCILLKKALEIKDKRNRKPIDLALELQSIGEDAILSVRRWDVVAGGEANFNYCVTLLQNAEKECHNSYNNDDNEYNNDDNNNDNEEIIMSSKNKMVLNDIISKCNCENNSNDDNQCKTSIWEAQFHSAMLQSTQALMKESNLNNNNTNNNNDQNKMSHEALQHNNNNDNADSDTKDKSNHTQTESKTIINKKKTTTSTSLGLACQKCGLKTISLFRFEQSYLVCQKCLKTLKHRY